MNQKKGKILRNLREKGNSMRFNRIVGSKPVSHVYAGKGVKAVAIPEKKPAVKKQDEKKDDK